MRLFQGALGTALGMAAMDKTYSWPVVSPAVEDTNAYGIVFWDDAEASQMLAQPIFKARGIPAMVNIITSIVGQANKLTWDNIRSLANDGWEVGNHTDTHFVMTGQSEADILNEIMTADTKLKQRHFVTHSMSTPQGSGVGVANFLTAAAQSPITFAGVNGYITEPQNVGYTPSYYPSINWLQIPFEASTEATIAVAKSRIDRAVLTKAVYCVYIHSIPFNYSEAALAELLDYGINAGLIWTTPSYVMGRKRAKSLDIFSSFGLQNLYNANDSIDPSYRGFPIGLYAGDVASLAMGTDGGLNYVRIICAVGYVQYKGIAKQGYAYLHDFVAGKQYTVTVEYRTSVPKVQTAQVIINRYTSNFTDLGVLDTHNLTESADWKTDTYTITVNDANARYLRVNFQMNGGAGDAGKTVDFRNFTVTQV